MEQKLIAITGAAGDIGHALSRRFLKKGHQVVALDINNSTLAERCEEMGTSSNYRPYQTDITDPKSVVSSFKSIKSDFGVSPDILVNNAGGISAHNLQSTTEETWTRDIEFNLNGAWRCMNAVIRDFIEMKSGVIINVASVNGIGIFGHPGYSAAKAGLIHLTKFAAVELGKHGIRVVAVCPGTVKTRAWIDRKKENPSIIEDALSWYPSRIASEPDDVANLIEFASLNAPDTMNGAILELDGGLTAGQDVVASAFCGDDV